MPRLITRHFVRPHQVIIDVGTTFIKDEAIDKIHGDVDFADVSDICCKSHQCLEVGSSYGIFIVPEYVWCIYEEDSY